MPLPDPVAPAEAPVGCESFRLSHAEMHMRALKLAVVVTVLASSAALAEEPTAPVAKAYEIEKGQLDDIKAHKRGPLDSPFREALFTERMAALVARNARCEEKGQICSLDFDPFINGQCCGLSNLKLQVASRAGSRAVVVATFKNVTLSTVLFDAAFERGAWRIDDIKDPNRDKKGELISIAKLLSADK